MIDQLVVHSVAFGEPPLTSYRPSESVEFWRRSTRWRRFEPSSPRNLHGRAKQPDVRERPADLRARDSRVRRLVLLGATSRIQPDRLSLLSDPPRATSFPAGACLDPDDGAIPWMQTAIAMRGQRPSRNRAGRRLSSEPGAGAIRPPLAIAQDQSLKVD